MNFKRKDRLSKRPGDTTFPIIAFAHYRQIKSEIFKKILRNIKNIV